MLNKIKALNGYKLRSLDGDIGKVKEFYFDDKHWTIRYLIADTGNWLIGNQVLISPYSLIAINKDDKFISINLTKKQIEESPGLENHKPVSRQFEDVYYGYYGWSPYYAGPYMWGLSPYILREQEKIRNKIEGEHANDLINEEKASDPHLRSSQNMSGLNIQATDGEIGHVDDFIIDDLTWAIRYLIIDTVNWWPGKKVLVAPQWIESINWDKSKVFVNLTRDVIKRSPEYIEDKLINLDYETALHKHYDRQGYWPDEQSDKKSL